MKKPNWIIEKIRYHTDDEEDYPVYFPEDYGLGLTFRDNKGVEYKTVGKIPQTLQFDVSSFRGLSIGAIHYYGSIRLYEPELIFIDEDGKPTKHSISGSFSKYKPIQARGLTIKINRFITSEELEDENRWRGYHENSLVDGFETEEELWKYGISLIKKRFKGNWMIDVDGFYDTLRRNNGEINIKNLK